MNLADVAIIVFALNLPFGYWRANVKKMSLQWFLSIHLPVPAVIALRFLARIGWQLFTFPVLIGAFFSGQFVGSKIHRWFKHHSNFQPTSCLIWDMIRQIQTRFFDNF